MACFDTSEELVFGFFNSVIQGDHMGVEIATQGHRGLLKEGGFLDRKEELQSCVPFFGEKALQGLVIDDYFSVSVEKVDELKAGSRPTPRHRFDQAQRIYDKAGLMGSKDKDVINSTSSKIVGGRRPLMCIFDQVYQCCDMAFVNQASTKLVKMSRKVKEELTLVAILAPLICADLAAETLPKVFATDASDKKGAFVGLFQRYFGELERGKEDMCECFPARRPYSQRLICVLRRRGRLPKAHLPALIQRNHWHSGSTCGGAGKVAREIAAKALSVGPVVDLDRSPFFDLQLFRVRPAGFIPDCASKHYILTGTVPKFEKLCSTQRFQPH